MKTILSVAFTNICLVFGGILIALVLTEGVSRIFVPIFPGAQKLTIEGQTLGEIDMVKPGLTYRQYAQEYDALTSITKNGYRVPETTGNPDIIFIGDSFTFGQGLADDETFIHLYCTHLKISCANLGVPGASTISELDRLEKFLEQENWRPKKVFLFMLAMTGFMGAGNDLYDNWHGVHGAKNESEIKISPKKKSVLSAILGYREMVLKYSNLARAIKFQFGPMLKAILAPEPDDIMLQTALEITEQQLSRFDTLSRKHSFEYRIFLLHPVQDISRGTDTQTLKALQFISPAPIIPTGALFENSPSDYYFPLDGHLNAKGSQRIAEFLLQNY